MFATSQVPQVPSYSQTGIPGLNGGYAYAPGSPMTQFMDNLNTTTKSATGDVLTWANGLLYQAQQRKQAQAMAMMTAPPAPTTGSTDQITQITQLLFTMMAALAQKQN